MWLTIAEEQTWPETLKIYKTHKYSNVTAIVDNKLLIIALNLDLTQKSSFLLSLTGIKNIRFGGDISRSTNLRLRCFFSCLVACCSLLLALPVSFDSIFLQNDVRSLNKEDARTHTHFTVKLALGGKISCWGFVFVICSFYLLSVKTHWHFIWLLWRCFICRHSDVHFEPRRPHADPFRALNQTVSSFVDSKHPGVVNGWQSGEWTGSDFSSKMVEAPGDNLIVFFSSQN